MFAQSSPSGYTPPTTPASAPSLPSPETQVCITPPTQRRREARIIYCAYVNAQAARDREAGAEAVPEIPRTEYNAEEVAARRTQGRLEEWMGWADYEGPVVDEDGVLGMDGTVRDWDAGVPSEDDRDMEPAFGLAPDAGYQDFLDGMGQVGYGGAERTTTQRLGGGRLATAAAGALDGPGLPLVLGALYVLARAAGIGGSAQRRQRNGGEVQGKVHALQRRS